jgi:hypothetical protein
MGEEYLPFQDDDDDYYDEYGIEDDFDQLDMDIMGGRGAARYQDGILEDDISSNARFYPEHGTHRSNRRQRKPIHRYPHHTHERRETQHSLAD